MLDHDTSYIPPEALRPKVAVHIDDIPQTPAEQTVAEEVLANVEFISFDEKDNLGFHLSNLNFTCVKPTCSGIVDS